MSNSVILYKNGVANALRLYSGPMLVRIMRLFSPLKIYPSNYPDLAKIQMVPRASKASSDPMVFVQSTVPARLPPRN